jgi:rod shape-determining protein MreB and related proteins
MFSFGSTRIAVDLGTANTLVYIKGEGIVLNEPSVIAVDRESGRVLATGRDAKAMIGRTSGNVLVVRPLRDGVIADVDLAELMLRDLLSRALGHRRFRSRPTLVVGVPSTITKLERRAVLESVQGISPREAFLIAEPIAAAIGVGLPVRTPRGSLIVDIGGGTTECCTIAMSGIIADGSIRVGGDEMDQAVVAYMRRHHGLSIGEVAGEQLKIQVGSAGTGGLSDLSAEVSGRDLVTGMPRTISVTSSDLRLALREPIDAIAAAVIRALEMTPPELASDIVEHGIVLTGGGALVRGLDGLLAETTGLAVHVDQDPLTCVVRGAAQAAEDIAGFREMLAA